jgi:Trypsin
LTKLLALAALAGALVFATPAAAITFGQPDGNLHPYVGALFADYDPDVPGPDLLCSGTLVRENPGNTVPSNVFVTASHCTDYLQSLGIPPNAVWVSFHPRAGNAEGGVAHPESLRPGTYYQHPEFGFSGPGGFSDPHDIAVVLLDSPVTGVTPARLPRLNLLNEIALKRQRFTAVGYGTVRNVKTGGFNSLFFEGIRRYVTQGFRSLTKSWLNLSMNPSTGSGGTCYGDSGGPHFLGGPTSNLLVSITVTGDAPCRATDVTYRLDTRSARAFLDDFVTLP